MKRASVDLSNITLKISCPPGQLQAQVADAVQLLLRNTKPADRVRSGSTGQRASERGSEVLARH